jgi:hypothetical protein
MSYGHTPGGEQAGGEQAGGEQEGPAGPRPEFGAPPAYPGQPGYASPGAPPPTYRAWGTTATVCGVLFNLILGLPTALIARRYSKKVTELWARGDPQAAISASRKTRAWLIASIVLDVIGLVLSVVLVVAQAASSRSDFNHPTAVAGSIKTQLQQRLSDKSSQYYEPGVTVTSVVCTPTGASTDRCTDTFSNGQTGTETAVISGNGTSYSTH